MLQKELVLELVNGLLAIFEGMISQIVLYGSVARQQDTIESDVDIAIILSRSIDEELKDEFISWVADMDLKYNKIFSIIDIEEDKMEKWGDILPFYKNIRKEGIVLWKAA
ncbi:MAG: nucleotidyltransferase domain-containing protein [Lachnospiraceae bacterium]|jgi:predicted nucleotidyltransferase|nr:nucleotidyltransferase domain-containing protein [Lachnospiraceae bacterium]